MNKITVLGVLIILPLVLTVCVIHDASGAQSTRQNQTARSSAMSYHTRPANVQGAGNDLKGPSLSLFNIDNWKSK